MTGFADLTDDRSRQLGCNFFSGTRYRQESEGNSRTDEGCLGESASQDSSDRPNPDTRWGSQRLTRSRESHKRVRVLQSLILLLAATAEMVKRFSDSQDHQNLHDYRELDEAQDDN
jgi:hypothetical protein